MKNLSIQAPVNIKRYYGPLSFVVVSVMVMTGFGMVPEGTPALILFGPLLTPIAVKLGVKPLQFGIVMMVSIGLGFFGLSA